MQSRVDQRVPGLARGRDQKRAQGGSGSGGSNSNNDQSATRPPVHQSVADQDRRSVHAHRDQPNEKSAVKIAPKRDDRNYNPQRRGTAPVVTSKHRDSCRQREEVE